MIMKLKFLLIVFCLFVFAFSVFSQTEKAKQIDEFGEFNCEDLLARSDNLLNELNKNPNYVAYIIFYEGKHFRYFYNKKNEKTRQ